MTDTGPGIDNEIIDKIFDPYFTTKAVGKGSGLGLSIVHGIVQNHNGQIDVKSNEGKGTIIQVLLPMVDNVPEAPLLRHQDPEGHGEAILFVDDEAAIVDMNEKILTKLGYRVTITLSSVEALALFKSDPARFDLIITDMTLPKMTGTELAVQIKEIRPDLPIIICTGHNSNLDEQKALEMGISAYLTKPISRTELAKRIRQVLGV